MVLIKLHGSLDGKLTHLLRTMEIKNKALVTAQGNLSSSQKELESFHIENASLTRQQTDFMNASLEWLCNRLRLSCNN